MANVDIQYIGLSAEDQVNHRYDVAATLANESFIQFSIKLPQRDDVEAENVVRNLFDDAKNSV